jgi:hypothetical protein
MGCSIESPLSCVPIASTTDERFSVLPLYQMQTHIRVQNARRRNDFYGNAGTDPQHHISSEIMRSEIIQKSLSDAVANELGNKTTVKDAALCYIRKTLEWSAAHLAEDGPAPQLEQ